MADTHLTCVPCKRQKRPSFSPQKLRSALDTQQQRVRSHSHSPTGANTQSLNESQCHNTIPHPNTAALEFEEFSFVDEQGDLKYIGSKWSKALAEYLLDHYQALSIEIILPYLIVSCEDHVPPPSERPFMIAGLVAVWLVDGEEKYMDVMNEIIFEDCGGSVVDGPWLQLPSDLLDDLKPFVIPKANTLWTIMHQHFPEAIAVSYISHRIVVEFEETSLQGYKNRLASLPNMIIGTEVALRYNNGPINGQETKRAKQPEPTRLDGDCDDTDYVQSTGCFYPGAMLSSKNDTTINAGVLLQKEDKVRLTVAMHCWDKQLESEVDLGHADYTVKQGDWENGTVVGRVTERIGISDIGLAKVDKPFSNRFLDLDGSAKSLLHSNDTRKVNELFWIDSFVTGRQQLASIGLKVIVNKRNKGNSQGSGSDPRDLPIEGTYVELVQGIYATDALDITGEPDIRAGISSAAVVRATKTKYPHQAPSSTTTPTPAGSATPVLKPLPQEDTAGEIAGFMHWSVSQSLHRGGLFCFADVTDQLIEDGWKVVQANEK